MKIVFFVVAVEVRVCHLEIHVSCFEDVMAHIVLVVGIVARMAVVVGTV